MKKYYLILISIFCFVLPRTAYAQLFFEYGLGYGTYEMTDLKNLLAANNILSGVMVTDNFPGYITHDLRIGYSKNQRISFGMLAGYMNTGGKKSLTDYSGFYRVEIRANAFKAAHFVSYQHHCRNPRIRCGIDLSAGGLFTNVLVDEEIKLIQVSVHEQEKTKLKGANLFVLPAIIGGYQLMPLLFVQGRIGYEWSVIKGGLRIAQRRTTLTADWSGLRIGVDIRLMFDI